MMPPPNTHPFRQARGVVARAQAALILAFGVAIWACDRDPVALAGSPIEKSLAVGSASADFRPYQFGSQTVDLAPDSSEMVVGADTDDALSALEAHANAAQVPLRRLERLKGRPGTWYVSLIGEPQAAAQYFRRRVANDSGLRFVSPAFRTRDGMLIRPLNLIAILFRPGVSPSEIESFAHAHRLLLRRAANPSAGQFDYDFAYPQQTRDPFAFASELSRHPMVAYADGDKVGGVERHVAPNDPYYSLQFYLKNSPAPGGVPVDIAVEPVWSFLGYQTSGLKIAVTDDGVQQSHADLVGRVENGYDAVGDCPACVTDPQLTTGAPLNGFSHGTAVAGIIAANQGNGTGIAGVVPGISIEPVRIFNSEGVAAPDLSIRNAINWAWNYGGVHVMSNSWGRSGLGSPSVDSAISNAVRFGRYGAGTPMVFSAGNHHPSWRASGIPQAVMWPARHPDAFAVSAIDRYGTIATYAPRGPELLLVAPSSPTVGPCSGDVLTVDRMGTPGCSDGPDASLDYNSSFGGTSAAAPQVAGVIALLLSRSPSLTVAEIRSRLIAGADPWGRTDDFGAGKLNATFTVLPLLSSINGPSLITAVGAYSWSASATGGDGTYSYTWHYQNWGSSSWIYLGAGPTVSRTIGTSTSRFKLRVTVGSFGRSVQAFREVVIDLGGCSPQC